MDSTPTSNAPAPKLTESIRRLFGPFAAVFGSAAAASAILVFAGFLSDLGAYRLAGLPRLNMTLIALSEQGADTLIDALSLLAGGLRMPVLGLLLATVVLCWGWRDSPLLQQWARSRAVYRSSRIVLLILAVWITGGLIERAQRSLSGTHYSPPAIEAALTSAYGGPRFPTPYERELSVERQSYELRVFQPVNWAARLDITWRDWLHRAGFGDASSDRGAQVTGIPLRQLRDARIAARHVFGWLSLFVLVICGGIVLLAWWEKWLGQQPAETFATPGPEQAVAAEGSPEAPAADPRGLSGQLPWPLRVLAWPGDLLGDSADEPIERLLVPLTVLAAVLSMALLPLAHGLLARESLGAETIMVYLRDGQPEMKTVHQEKTQQRAGSADPSASTENVSTLELSQQVPPSSQEFRAPARLDCKGEIALQLQAPVDSYRERLRDFMQLRPHEQERRGARTQLSEAITALVGAAIESGCAESVAVLWAIRPPVGMRALDRELAETYHNGFRLAQVAFGVRVGTLLSYPRESQALFLADIVTPRSWDRGGRSTVVELSRNEVAEYVILTNAEPLRLQAMQRQISMNPDSVDAAKGILLTVGEGSLDIAIALLMDKKLHTPTAGVAITALGTMAGVASIDGPAAATRAIDRLADLASSANSRFWPEKTGDIRGAAVSALHLTQSPYAAYRLVAALQAEPAPTSGCPDEAANAHTPLSCLTTVPTAAGFVLQDLVAEIQNFRSRQAPDILLQARDAMVGILVDIIVRPNVRDDVRGAACTALGFAGKFEVGQAVRERYWKNLKGQSMDEVPFSAPICLGQATVVGIEPGALREWLRAVARGGELGTQDENLAFIIRRTALVALNDVGVADEDALLLELFLGRYDKVSTMLAEFSEQLLPYVSPEPLAKRLFDCSADVERTGDERRRCLDAFRHVSDSYDGDEGIAAALYRTLSQDISPDPARTCAALATLAGHGSRWLGRLQDDDPVIGACTTTTGEDSADSQEDGDAEAVPGGDEGFQEWLRRQEGAPTSDSMQDAL